MACLWLWNLLTSFLSIALGLFVLANGYRKPVNVLWFITCISVAVWDAGYGMMLHAPSLSQAAFWQRWFLYTGSICIPVFFLHFVSLVTGFRAVRPLFFVYALAFLELFFSFTGRFGTVSGPRPPFNFYGTASPLFSLYFAAFLICAIYAHVLLFRKIAIAEDRAKQQMKYIGLGTAIGFAGGSTTFLYSYGISILPWGAFLVPVYIVTVTYAIVKHQLMDIRVAIKKTLIYSTVTATLTVVYVLITIGLARGLSLWMVTSTTFVSAAAAGVIALLFHPLRMKVQRFVDRHFFRESLDQELLREATSGFIHEIKKPLTNISLPAELSLMDVEDLLAGRKLSADILPKIRDRLRYIVHQAGAAGDKIEAIREFSALDRKHSDAVDLSEIIQRCISAEQALLIRHDVQVNVELADHLPPILGNAKQLEIVFSNLIKNAGEALGAMDSSAQRVIKIQAKESGAAVTVSVKDSGPGIKTENLHHLFEPYFTTKGAQGMGLGLYLCHQIVRSHGGTIAVESSAAAGSAFTLSFPIAK